MRRTALLRFICLLTLAAVALPIPSANAVDLVPFKATYAVSYMGVRAGLLHFELRAAGDGRYVYETHATPGLVASFIISKKAIERSIMHIDADGVRPLSWSLDDGKSGKENDGALEFAWAAKRVTGTVQGERVDLPTEPGLQDRLSFQIAAMIALLRGDEPGTIPMLDDDRIKPYSYSYKGAAGRIETPAGEFDTVVYESTRPRSKRFSRIWHAPALGYLAVRFERLNRDKVETVMELVSVERRDAGR
jgi:hypothetical protein